MTYAIRILPYSTSIGTHENFGQAHDLVPDYLYDQGLRTVDATLRGDSTVQLRVPDWSDPIYLQGCKDLAKALAEKYDGNPLVEYIDIRTFGNWGEWHTSQMLGSDMPSVAIQKEMLAYYAAVFQKTLLVLPSNAAGEVYEYALSLGITKRNDGMIAIPGREEDLLPAYQANLPTVAENFASYAAMLANDDSVVGGYRQWTPARFRNVIETGHLTYYALDQTSDCGYQFYQEQRALIDEMVNRLGYNFTVTTAKRTKKQLVVTIKNTGLAPAYFDLYLTAEFTDANGTRSKLLDAPIKIAKGTFTDGSAKTFCFALEKMPAHAEICLGLYESYADAVQGSNPTVKFDNRNTLPNRKLWLKR